MANMAEEKSDNLLDKLVPILLISSIGLAFVVGVLWQKVAGLEGSKGLSAGVTTTPSPQNEQQLGAEAEPTNGKLSEEQAAKIAAIEDDDHIRGSKDAKVYLIEYSDYECPFCSRFHDTAKQVMDEYGDSVAWVYRHFPLDQLHPKARPAAVASECVAELGGSDAFWKFTDEIYTDQAGKLADIESVAVNSGVNLSAFQSCVESGKYDDRVSNDISEGGSAGVRGTPGNFIVNDKGDAWFIPGAYPFESLKVTIDEALAG